MTAADAQQVTNRAVLSGRKFVSRTRILVVPVMLAFILDVVPWPASETLRRLIVALISASGLPANSPQLLSRQSRIALSRRETAARYGDAAAELSHRTSAAARRAIRLMYASLVLFVLLFNFLGYNWPSARGIQAYSSGRFDAGGGW